MKLPATTIDIEIADAEIKKGSLKGKYDYGTLLKIMCLPENIEKCGAALLDAQARSMLVCTMDEKHSLLLQEYIVKHSSRKVVVIRPANWNIVNPVGIYLVPSDVAQGKNWFKPDIFATLCPETAPNALLSEMKQSQGVALLEAVAKPVQDLDMFAL
jgi:hypothetical protein